MRSIRISPANLRIRFALLLVLCSLASPASAGTLTVSAMIPVGHSPQQAAVTPNGIDVYVTNISDNTVNVIDTATNAVSFTLSVGASPSSIAVSPDGAKVYVGDNGGSVSIIDTATKAVTIIATLGPVRQLTLTPDGTKLYLAMEFGGLWQLATATNSLSQVSSTVCPEGVAVTPNGSTLYVSYQCFGPGGSPGHDAIGIFNATTNAFLSSITSLANVGEVERISPNGQQLWEVGGDACSSPAYDHVGCPPVPGVPESVVNVIATSSNALIQPLGGLGTGYLSFFPDSKRIFLSTGTTLQIVDTTSFAVVDTIALPGSGSVAFTPDGTRAYAPLPSQNAVAVLSAVLTVAIDIKPDEGSDEDPPPINSKSEGKIPVAILSSPTFDAPGTIDRTSLTFGRTGSEQSLAFCNPGGEDVNGDGVPDLVCHFNTPLTGFRLGDTVGVLRGKTLAGVAIQGTDPIRIVH